MKYKASEIVNRALQMSDLTNTDFISNDENIHLLNESWKEFYQLLINKGDKQFVKEVELSGSNLHGVAEYDMPEDCYQIQSIKNPYNGSIIPRKAESESITSCSYEVFNDKIRLYGTVGTVVMTYYTLPELITVPDKTIYPDISYSTISTVTSNISNSFINSDNNVFNIVTSEPIATTENNGILIGNRLIVSSDRLYDFDGNDLGVSISTYNPEYQYLIDSHNCKYLYNGSGGYTFINNTIELNGATRGVIFSTGDILHLKNATIHLNDVSTNLTPLDTGCQYIASFGDHEFAVLGGYIFEYYDGALQNYEELKYNGILQFVSKYGPVIYDGEVKVLSAIPDTEFNFPNELYIMVLAASLAVKYAMKQNASVEGLNNLYDNYKSNFLNSLSQDASYTRITNIYGR